MDKYKNPGEISNTLSSIWGLANSDIPTLRARLHISRTEMSRCYKIPLRTLENWDAGKNAPPEFVRNLLYYSIFINLMEGDDEK